MNLMDFIDIYDYDYFIANDTSIDYNPLDYLLKNRKELGEKESFIDDEMIRLADLIISNCSDSEKVKNSINDLKSLILESFEVNNKIIDLECISEGIRIAIDIKIKKSRVELLMKIEKQLQENNYLNKKNIIKKLIKSWPWSTDDLGGIKWPDEFLLNNDTDKCKEYLQEPVIERHLLKIIESLINSI